MTAQLHTASTADEAAQLCARQILQYLEEAIDVNRRATLAVSGGSTPKLMFKHMAAADFDWRSVHLFWVDERAVAPSDPDSNFKLTEECLLKPARLPQKNIHRIQGELPPPTAAKLYANEIREFFGVDDGDLPRFDVIHLGLGEDGHTASLFPGEPLLADRDNFAAAIKGPKPPPDRITLLPGVLLSARATVFLAAGKDKAEPLECVFHGPDDPAKYPAQLISRHGRRVQWFVDDAAAARLPRAITT